MDWKKLGARLLFPPVWLMAVLTVLSAVMLTAVFLRGWEQTVVAYVVYVLSAYTLTVVCIFCAMVLPKRYRQIRERILSTPLGHRYMTDRAFRTRISLWISFGVNMLYVGINLWSWHTLGSWWFMVLAVYYVIMAVLRSLLLGSFRQHQIGTGSRAGWVRARSCACILLLVNLSLSGAVLMILYESKGYDYPGIMIYVMAMYTFYSTIHAVVDIVKYRKLGSPILSTAKIVSLCAALVSMLNLETAMFAQFGGQMQKADQRLMIILTGAGVSVTVVTLSVGLIIKATKEIGRDTYGK